MIAKDREYDLVIADAEQVQVQAGGGLDPKSFAQLKRIEKKVPKNMAFLPRFSMDPSLEDMTVCILPRRKLQKFMV